MLRRWCEVEVEVEVFFGGGARTPRFEDGERLGG